MTVVIGTAGHIDHGKTTLLRALTGTDADRLPEEQRRGRTIDVGYAHFAPDDGDEVDFVDVPGHDRLVGNMLVGAGEIDACLLVVAADDGPRAQTWEHLGLLDALRIRHGLVAITKTDLVPGERVGSVIEHVCDSLAGTSLNDAPLIAVSATSGEGLDDLRRGLASLRDRVEATGGDRGAAGVRLAVDRVFSVRGRGVVVTGSSRGKRVGRSDALDVVPDGPNVRVRGLQVHDEDVERGPAGGRVALNLAGTGSQGLRRGQVLVSGSVDGDALAFTSSDRLLAVLHRPSPLPGRADEPWPPLDGGQARFHIGTDQADATLGRSGRDGVELPDGRAVAMLRLDRPIAAAVGERLLLRRPPPAGLFAGGIVLDAAPQRGRSRRRQSPRRLAHLVSAVDAGTRDDTVAALLDLHGLMWSSGEPRLADDVGSVSARAVLDTVRRHHQEHPQQAGLPISSARASAAAAVRAETSVRRGAAERAATNVVDELLERGDLQRDDDAVRAPEHRPLARDPGLDAAMDRLVELLTTAAPPSLSASAGEVGCPVDGVRELERDGRIIVVDDDLAWSADAYGALRDQALHLAATTPLTPAALRDATGTSRKYVMALLEDLDRRGILRRTPAGHVPGPRAQEA